MLDKKTNRNGWDFRGTGYVLRKKKGPIPHLGYSLCVGAVPSLQRSQPGSEQPKLTAERRMQQNKTSTWSRQKHIQPEVHPDILA